MVKHHLPTKGGIQEVSLIPEGDVWRLIIRSKLPQAVEIEKWIMDEVLPTIRKTGTYTMKQKPKTDKPYEYFDKTYNGEAVLTSSDVEYLTKINRATIDWYLRTKCVKGKDYYYTTGDELKKYKTENPKVSRLLSALYLITREGFIKICRAYGVQIDTPKCFEVKKKQNNDFPISKLIDKLKREYGYDISVKSLTQEIADEYTDGIIRNQSLTVKIHNKYYIFVDDSAPLPNKEFLTAQGIGCVISGQLRGKCRCLVTEYSNSTLSFASAFMAMLMMSND